MIPRQNFNVLCVDDNIAILELLGAAFLRAGYGVEMAKNAFVALQKVNKNPQRFQLIITDIRMPGLDGFGLIEQARATGYPGAFVVYAAMISPDDRQRLRELRVHRVLSKPTLSGEIIAAAKDVQTGF
jgi:two-component system chemotaxis response regulator CheY